VVEQFPIENLPGVILGLATRGLNVKTEKNAITPYWSIFAILTGQRYRSTFSIAPLISLEPDHHITIRAPHRISYCKNK
jgi:hypothetical protein